MKLLLTLLLLSPLTLLAHGDEEHKSSSQEKVVQTEAEIAKNILIYKEINIVYQKSVKPIFEKKCFDCHANTTVFPWYYKIPGVKQMIDYDIKTAQKHMKMDGDFPFVSHETPLKDLKSIQEAISENEMPPLKYILGHWDARLTKAEKVIVKEWTQESILKLKIKN